MKVELYYFGECPNAERARILLKNSMSLLGLSISIDEHDGEFHSPTIRVNGVDVMGEPATSGRTCRLDVPGEAEVVNVLRRAMASDGQEAPMKTPDRGLLRRLTRGAILQFVAVLLLGQAACCCRQEQEGTIPRPLAAAANPALPALRPLDDAHAAEFMSAFDEATQRPRYVVLLSPT